eukprot:snap_masked-scaffold_49-processed-gene-0.17-mRNA-1 protein AED:1.00 eAED:1.00 QI:0/0/0/0/1/1/2/0/695
MKPWRENSNLQSVADFHNWLHTFCLENKVHTEEDTQREKSFRLSNGWSTKENKKKDCRLISQSLVSTKSVANQKEVQDKPTFKQSKFVKQLLKQVKNKKQPLLGSAENNEKEDLPPKIYLKVNQQTIFINTLAVTFTDTSHLLLAVALKLRSRMPGQMRIAKSSSFARVFLFGYDTFASHINCKFIGIFLDFGEDGAIEDVLLLRTLEVFRTKQFFSDGDKVVVKSTGTQKKATSGGADLVDLILKLARKETDCKINMFSSFITSKTRFSSVVKAQFSRKSKFSVYLISSTESFDSKGLKEVLQSEKFVNYSACNVIKLDESSLSFLEVKAKVDVLRYQIEKCLNLCFEDMSIDLIRNKNNVFQIVNLNSYKLSKETPLQKIEKDGMKNMFLIPIPVFNEGHLSTLEKKKPVVKEERCPGPLCPLNSRTQLESTVISYNSNLVKYYLKFLEASDPRRFDIYFLETFFTNNEYEHQFDFIKICSKCKIKVDEIMRELNLRKNERKTTKAKKNNVCNKACLRLYDSFREKQKKNIAINSSSTFFYPKRKFSHEKMKEEKDSLPEASQNLLGVGDDVLICLPSQDNVNGTVIDIVKKTSRKKTFLYTVQTSKGSILEKVNESCLKPLDFYSASENKFAGLIPTENRQVASTLNIENIITPRTRFIDETENNRVETNKPSFNSRVIFVLMVVEKQYLKV